MYYSRSKANDSIINRNALQQHFPRKSADEFVGRDAELVELHEKLQQSQMVGVRPAAALTGLGGIGKTQLAVEYAYRYQASYPGGIFWINAADLNRVRSALMETAERMGLRTDYNTSDNALLAGLVKRCQQPKSENAQLLLRIAGQLPEAAEIPIARLGLLAGLTDERVIRPLTSAIQTLWKAAPIEELKTDAIRLHPLVRDFATGLMATDNRSAFCNACAQRLATAYSDWQRLGHEYAARGIAALLIDLMSAIDLAQPPLPGRPSPLPDLQALLRLLRREANHLQATVADRQPHRLWQQVLPRTGHPDALGIHQTLRQLLRQSLHWLPVWGHPRQAAALEQTLTGREEWVNDVAVVDSQRIVSTSHNTVKVWNLSTGQVEQTLFVQFDSNCKVAVIDGQCILPTSSLFDGKLNVWNLQTGQVAQTLTSHVKTARSVTAVDGQRVVVRVSQDRTFKVLNLTTGQVEQTLTGHEMRVNKVAVVDGQRIVFTSDDRTFKIWNLQTGQVEEMLTDHAAKVNSVTAVGRQRVVTASSDHTLKVWNLQTGQVLTSIGLDGALTCVAVTQQNGRTLVVAGDGGGALYCLELVEPVGGTH